MTDKFSGRQVIQYLDNDKVRVYEIKEWDDDPESITTIELSGAYKDVSTKVEK